MSGIYFMKNFATIFLIFTMFLPWTSVFSQETSTPELGDPYANVLTLEEETVIGFSTYRRLQKYNFIFNDPLVNTYIKYLGNLLTRHTLDSKRNYTFFVTKSDSINAFALPGAFVGLNNGLIMLTTGEDQLAGVVAHEIAHVNLRHSAEMLANTARTSLPAYIGIIIAIFSGNPQAAMAAMQAGLGVTAQMNINLIRSNEVEADEFAINLFRKANFNISQMATFFDIMQSSTSSIDPQLAYFYTHPLYENRIAKIKSRAGGQNNSSLHSSDDYRYVKNILEVFQTTNVHSAINSTKHDNIYDLHKLTLLHVRKSNYETAKSLIESVYKKNKENVYIAILYAQLLNKTKKHEEAIIILENLTDIYPFNSSIPYYLSEILIEHNLKLNQALNILKKVENTHVFNPDYLRLMSRLFVLKNDVFNSKLYLSEYYLMMDNLNLAVQILNDGIQSKNLKSHQINTLKKKKKQIICNYQRPLEPIFGEKTCD